MLGTLALIVGFSTLFFTVLLSGTGFFSLSTMIVFVVGFNVLQWLIAPYMIGALYRVKELPRSEQPWLHEAVAAICRRTGIQAPRVMLANLPLPNAFAYGSPLAGQRIAVTTGLLDTLEAEEVEAVLGHEIGHLKHRDVQIMMFASVLPAIFYYLGTSLMWSSMWGGSRERNGSGGLLIGVAAMAIYWVLTLFVLGLSRLREYYADQHGVQHVPDGARKLSEALAKISTASARRPRGQRTGPSAGSFRSLFISDPDHSAQDAVALSRMSVRGDVELVREIVSRKVSGAERFVELFSTHPNIVKRLRALQGRQ